MAFISSGYNPAKPMEGRITDIGPRHFEDFYPPVIKKNKGKWDYHEILKPGSWSTWPSPGTRFTPCGAAPPGS
jgi:hypothetical protein